MRTERVGTRFQTPRPSTPSIVTRTIETGAARHGVSAGERTSRIDCRGSGIRGLHIAPFAGSKRRWKVSPSGEAVTSPSETMDGFWAWALLSSFGDRVTVPAERAYMWLFNS